MGEEDPKKMSFWWEPGLTFPECQERRRGKHNTVRVFCCESVGSKPMTLIKSLLASAADLKNGVSGCPSN